MCKEKKVWSKKRLGRFRVSGMLLEVVAQGDLDSDHAKSLMQLFGKMIVIRANDCPWKDSTDYVAISPLFEEIGEGTSVPWYTVEWQIIDHGEDYAEQGHAYRVETIAKAFKIDTPAETW